MERAALTLGAAMLGALLADLARRSKLVSRLRPVVVGTLLAWVCISLTSPERAISSTWASVGALAGWVLVAVGTLMANARSK